MTVEHAALLVTWVAITLLALGLAALLQQVRILTERQAGTTVPSLVGVVPPALEGVDFQATHTTLLLFVSPTCSTCATIVSQGKEPDKDRVQLVLIGDEPVEQAERSIRMISAPGLFRMFGVSMSPFAIVIDHQGVIRQAQPVGSLLAFDKLINTLSKEEAA